MAASDRGNLFLLQQGPPPPPHPEKKMDHRKLNFKKKLKNL